MIVRLSVMSLAPADEFVIAVLVVSGRSFSISNNVSKWVLYYCTFALGDDCQLVYSR